MATKINKYIGERYIPIYGGEWDISKSYEHLTVVTNGGNSYTSRTYVPVGIDITNTTYWYCSASYNAQIESYRQEVVNAVNQVNKDMDNLETTINTQFETLKQENTTYLQNALSNINATSNVLDFGASGDGLTDDLQAFKDCLAHCKTNKVKMLIPSKTFYLSSSLVTDESLVSVNNGSYPNGKFIVSGKVDLACKHIQQLTVKAVSDYISDNSDNYYAQSIVFVESTNHFVIGFASVSEDYNSYLVEVDTDFNLVKTSYGDFGHVNDLSYNASKGEIYCAHCGVGSYGMSISVIDASTLRVTKTVSFTTAPYTCSYDDNSTLLYVACGDKILNVLETTNFTTVQSINLTFNGIDGTYIAQGSFMLEGEYFQIHYKRDYVLFYQFNLATGYIKNIVEYNVGYNEVEGLCYYNNALYGIACDTSNHMTEYFKLEHRVSQNDYLATKGIQLKTGDLNTYARACGKFFVSSGTDAKNIANIPDSVTSGFAMFVVKVGYDHYNNVIFTNNGQFIMRHVKPSEIGGWMEIEVGTPKTKSINVTGNYIGFVTNGMKELNFSIPKSEKMLTRDGVTLNCVAYIRQNGSYLLGASGSGASLDSDAFTVTISQSDIFYNVRLTFTDVIPNATNNAECSVYLNGTLESL